MKNSTSSLIVIVVGFLLFTLLNHLLLGSARLDLTDNKLYTLADGTIEVLEDLDEPVNLYFFFSDKASQDLTTLRAYANRVKEMLEEYQLVAGSRINLTIIDPEPFSEEEDLAAEYGLQGVPINQAGDELFFGLAGTNALDGRETIAFFQPDNEAFLEYELTKLIYSLSTRTRPSIGVFSSLQVDGSVDQATLAPTPAWMIMTQLRELFSVTVLEEINPTALEAVDLLMLIHPRALGDEQLFAIDQHVMSGGRLVAFLDPMAEMDQAATPGMQMPGMMGSEINRLTRGWGVTLRENEILADADAALMVGGSDGAPVRHLGILGFTSAYLAADDIVTAPLEAVNLSTVGIFDLSEVAGLNAEPLMISSRNASTLPSLQFQFLTDPAELQRGFKPVGEQFVTAVRLSGKAASAFPGRMGSSEEFIASTENLQVVMVADTDLLADRLWVSVQSFFGQQVASAFADNGSFVTNLVDNLSGSASLIDVRSRGQFSRPFTVVEQLRRDAEEKYLQSAQDLQVRLAETDRKLAELEASRVEDGLLTLSDEQELALNQFQDEKLKIRKQLRDVRHQLDKDIEELGTQLKFLNILLMPLLLTIGLVAFRVLGLGRRSSTTS